VNTNKRQKDRIKAGSRKGTEKIMESARRRKTEQAERTAAFYASTRDWYWREVRAWENHMAALGVPAFAEAGSTACGMIGMHRCGGGLEVDHVGTRKDKDPAQIQTLCHYANMAKGSQKGSKWDFRSDGFKAWLREARDRDWVWNHLHSAWERRTHG
jgi:hypothetical protein